MYTTCCLLYNIHKRYNFSLVELIYISPRFGIMLLAMVLSIVFTITDICSVTNALKSALPDGLNPFWKLAFVFKLLTDSVILDDFKTALDKLSSINLNKAEERSGVWSNSRNAPAHRETVFPAKVMPTRMGSSESGEPWIAVTTETKVESFQLEDVRVPHAQ